MGESENSATVYEMGDEHRLTILGKEVLFVGKVFRSAGNVPEQEAVYWEVMDIEPNEITCLCKVVGINAYMRTVM